MIESIEEEASYHSIVVMRTRSKALAQRFPHTIFSKDEAMNISPDKDESDLDYNYELDAVKYSWQGQKIIMASFSKVQCVFDEVRVQELRKSKFFRYEDLKQSELLFFLYLNTQDFIEIMPVAIISSTFVFEIKQESIQLLCRDEKFKEMCLLNRQKENSSQTYYHFNSQFGLLSDLHFLNNFIRGYRTFSSYRRQRTAYVHLIDPEICALLCEYYPLPKL